HIEHDGAAVDEGTRTKGDPISVIHSQGGTYIGALAHLTDQRGKSGQPCIGVHGGIVERLGPLLRDLQIGLYFGVVGLVELPGEHAFLLIGHGAPSHSWCPYHLRLWAGSKDLRPFLALRAGKGPERAGRGRKNRFVPAFAPGAVQAVRTMWKTSAKIGRASCRERV